MTTCMENGEWDSNMGEVKCAGEWANVNYKTINVYTQSVVNDCNSLAIYLYYSIGIVPGNNNNIHAHSYSW